MAKYFGGLLQGIVLTVTIGGAIVFKFPVLVVAAILAGLFTVCAWIVCIFENWD